MENSEMKIELYQYFVKLCNNIVNGKYLLSGDRISQLLQFIASSKEMTDYVAFCNKGVNYKTELAQAMADDKIFKLPISNKKIVALVTGLLFDFDRGNIHINTFMNEYFSADDHNEAFTAMCYAVIVPYYKAFKDMLLEETPFEEKVEDKEKVKMLDEVVKEQLMPYVTSLAKIVAEDLKLDEVKKQEYLQIIEGMEYVINNNDVKLIKAMFIGLKNVLNTYKPSFSNLKAMVLIFKNYSLI
ncbi:MAG: hypothetical protein RR454_03770 [Clostridia bacterium]